MLLNAMLKSIVGGSPSAPSPTRRRAASRVATAGAGSDCRSMRRRPFRTSRTTPRAGRRPRRPGRRPQRAGPSPRRAHGDASRRPADAGDRPEAGRCRAGRPGLRVRSTRCGIPSRCRSDPTRRSDRTRTPRAPAAIETQRQLWVASIVAARRRAGRAGRRAPSRTTRPTPGPRRASPRRPEPGGPGRFGSTAPPRSCHMPPRQQPTDRPMTPREP